MGVHGLWQLLDPLGRPVSLDSLQNKVLAVDASIWLHQSVRGFRDKHGNPLPNAHLLGLFNRVCKLLFYGIKPVFVFDGQVPLLKKQTMAKRRERQQSAAREVEKKRREILTKYMQSRAIRDALGDEKDNPSDAKSHLSLSQISSDQVAADIYNLPPMPSMSEAGDGTSEAIDNLQDSDEDADTRLASYQDLDAVDIDSKEFQTLPDEIQYEILVELKTRLRYRSWTKHGILPENSEDIGHFQIKQLLGRRKIQSRLDIIRKRLTTPVTSGFGSDSESESRAAHPYAEIKRIASEDSTHYILLKFKGASNLVLPSPVPEQPDGIPRKERSFGATKLSVSSDQTNRSSSQEVPKGSFSSDSDVHRWAPTKILDDSQITILDEEPPVKILDESTPIEVSDGKPSAKIHYRESPAKIFDQESPVKILDEQSAAPILEKEPPINTVTLFDPLPKCVPGSDVGSSGPDVLLEISESQDVQISNPQPSKSVQIDFGYSETDSLKSAGKSSASENFKQLNDICIVGRAEEKQTNLNVRFAALEYATNSSKSTGSLEQPPGHTELAARVEDATVPMVVRQTAKETVISKDVPECGVMSSEDEDDFIEVPAHGHQEPDDLFPIEMFQRSQDSDSSHSSVTESVEEIHEDQSGGPLTFEDLPSRDPEELRLIGKELERETETLLDDKNRQERIAATLTDQMYVESQELLKLFGIPYVVSPAEAEAQCALLDAIDLCDGTITDDSDVWLFGAKRVYKNFFERHQDMLFFQQADIQKRLGLDRSKLIAVALLTGSDYTRGVKSIGVVSALEILGEFKEDDGFQSLLKFKSWWEAAQQQRVAPSETKIKQQLRRVTLDEGFPNATVLDAYVNPNVDSSKERFSWGIPDLHALRQFASRKLGWTLSKTNDILLPVIKNLSAARERQTSISNYFSPLVRIEHEVKHPSKRLQRALRKVQSQDGQSSLEEGGEKVTSSQRSKPAPSRKREYRPRKCRGGGRKKVPKDQESNSEPPKELDLSESSGSDEDYCPVTPVRRRAL